MMLFVLILRCARRTSWNWITWWCRMKHLPCFSYMHWLNVSSLLLHSILKK